MMWEIDCLDDGTVVTCSQIIRNNGQEQIEAHFERPIMGGFDAARFVMPGHRWLFVKGYSAEEVNRFTKFLLQNRDKIWDYSEKKGEINR